MIFRNTNTQKTCDKLKYLIFYRDFFKKHLNATSF